LRAQNKQHWAVGVRQLAGVSDHHFHLEPTKLVKSKQSSRSSANYFLIKFKK
jgi:hypothetical protein